MKSNSFKQLTFIIICVMFLPFKIFATKADKDLAATKNAGFAEKRITLSNGVIINYAEGPDNGKKALLLVHGQAGAWQDYKKVLPKLSKNWHVYAVDCHGHGKSTHDATRYYIDSIGNDLIRLIHEVIKKETVISGHSSGALIAAYVSGNENTYTVGSLLEDPPVFSTEKEVFSKTFAYWDFFINVHNYLKTDKSEIWEIYYLQNCYWGKLYIPALTKKMSDAAKIYQVKHPNKPIKLWFVPKKTNEMIQGLFTYIKDFDLQFGENYYDSSFQNGISHEKLMTGVEKPCIFLHAKDAYVNDPSTGNSILLAASSDEHAHKAVSLMKNCELVEIVSGHDIHFEKPDEFIMTLNKLLFKL